MNALAERFFVAGDVKVAVEGKKVKVTPKKEILTTKEYAAAKAHFISQVGKKLPQLEVEFVESYGKSA